MDNKTTFKRGDMFYADMPQGVGSEQSGYRPVIILQNDVGNKHLAYDLINDGYIRGLKIGHSFRIPKVNVIEYVMDQGTTAI